MKDQAGTQSYTVVNSAYLTPLQEKMMSTQPDLILQYAYYPVSYTHLDVYKRQTLHSTFHL